MGGGRGISHVDMPRESQDGGAEVYHMLICRGRAKMGGAEVYHMLICRGRAKMGGAEVYHMLICRGRAKMGGAEVYHMLICRGRAKMGRGRGISHVDMPRESQDGGGQRYITC